MISPHQLNPIDEQASHDDRTNDESFISHTHRSSDRSQKRPMASSCLYWLNTGDNKNHNNTKSANFMRSTYAAKCRLHLSHSTERCPRALRGILMFLPESCFTCSQLLHLFFMRVCVCMLPLPLYAILFLRDF